MIFPRELNMVMVVLGKSLAVSCRADKEVFGTTPKGIHAGAVGTA